MSGVARFSMDALPQKVQKVFKMLIAGDHLEPQVVGKIGEALPELRGEVMMYVRRDRRIVPRLFESRQMEVLDEGRRMKLITRSDSADALRAALVRQDFEVADAIVTTCPSIITPDFAMETLSPTRLRRPAPQGSFALNWNQNLVAWADARLPWGCISANNIDSANWLRRYMESLDFDPVVADWYMDRVVSLIPDPQFEEWWRSSPVWSAAPPAVSWYLHNFIPRTAGAMSREQRIRPLIRYYCKSTWRGDFGHAPPRMRMIIDVLGITPDEFARHAVACDNPALS